MLRKIRGQHRGRLFGSSARASRAGRGARLPHRDGDRGERRAAGCPGAGAPRRTACASAASRKPRTRPAKRATRSGSTRPFRTFVTASRCAPAQPGLRRRGDPDARARHRREHRDLQRRPRRAAAVAAVRATAIGWSGSGPERAERGHRQRGVLGQGDRGPPASAAARSLERGRVPPMWFVLLGQGRARARPDGRRVGELLRPARRARRSSAGRSCRAKTSTARRPCWSLATTTGRTRFGGDPNVIGHVFQMNDRPHTVVGVLPPIPGTPQDERRLDADLGVPVPVGSARRIEQPRRAACWERSPVEAGRHARRRPAATSRRSRASSRPTIRRAIRRPCAWPCRPSPSPRS